MPRLIVQYKQKTIEELELTGDKVIIGRGEESGIKLDDNLVSREHAEIRKEGGKYLLSDLGSANGTYVGTKRITKDYELKDGDVIKISPYTIYFRLSPEEKPTQIAQAEMEEKPTEIFTFSGAPRFLVRSGMAVGQIYDLTNNPLIGRDPECDIVLNEPTVSRRHARIQFIENKLIIMDVGSKSGTRVNGRLIDRPTPLRDGDKVQLGEVLLEVDWKGAPRVETEKPTVPVFRPELMPIKKETNWWKWGIGIVAGLIIFFAIWTLIPKGRSYEDLISDTRVLFDDGLKTSNIEKLQIALAKVDSAIKKRVTEEGKKLKKDIENRIISITEALSLVEKAEQANRTGDYKKAIEYTSIALEKDSINRRALEEKSKAHRALAVNYELEGDRAKERRESYKANDLWNKALNEWNEVIAIDPTNPEAIEKKERLLKKLRGVVSTSLSSSVPSESRGSRLYEEAFNLYREGRLSASKEKVDKILSLTPNDRRVNELKDWIETWEIAKYNLEVRGDTGEAVKKFEELIQKDPGNTAVRFILGTIKPAPRWNSEKARMLFEEAEENYILGRDYGDASVIAKAKVKYQEIIEMGPPPSDASSQDHNIYSIAKSRMQEMK